MNNIINKISTDQEKDEENSTEFFRKSHSTPCHHYLSSYSLPSWVNPSLVLKGKEFVRKNFFSVFVAHFISLVILLCYTPVRNVLFKTEKSESINKSRLRYLSTLLHVKMWYEEDLLTQQGSAFKDIQRIRRAHAGVSKAVQLKLNLDKSGKAKGCSNAIIISEKSTDDQQIIQAIGSLISQNNNNEINFEWNPSIPISQLDMIVTQFCFMGFISLVPTKFGLFSSTPEDQMELEGFIHLWAVIGQMLGIQDKYNICLNKNSHRRKDILSLILIPQFISSNCDTLRLWNPLVSGISSYIIFIRLKSVLIFMIRDVLELEREFSFFRSNLFLLMNYYEILCYCLMSMCFNIWMKKNWIVFALNWFLRFGISLAAWRFRVKI